MGFVRDTLEKVCRLTDVLKFMEEDDLLAKSIALKGGTAINLTIFDLPRLSVDIDLDYCKSIEREEMLTDRKKIIDRIGKYETELLRKCIVFYSAIGTEQPPEKFEMNHIGKISTQQIKRDLNPVLRKGERFDLKKAQKEVEKFLASVMILTEAEENFWRAFAKGKYSPELVFGKSKELENISDHPMALWKCREK